SEAPPVPRAATAEQLVKQLDDAGIRHAAVLSVAYLFGSAHWKPVADEYTKVRSENDWTAEQVGRYPKRLVGFFGFNPLKDYALDELRRCAKNPRFKGVKLHFGISAVDVHNPAQVKQVSQVFRVANELRLPIVVHLWTLDKSYGREHSSIFLDQIVREAPDIPIQVAHLAGSGPRYPADKALSFFVDAIAARHPLTKNLYFDVASCVTAREPRSAENLALVAKRVRQLGLERVLFGSDRADTFNDPPKEAWMNFRRLPLT